MLSITSNLALDESELQESFIRASGPGGQNVNKVATAVQLRFDVRNSPSLPEPVKARLYAVAKNRISADGVITIQARRFRTQEQNRADARERLAAVIRQVLEPPKARRPTKPTRAVRARRLETKHQHSQTKQLRRSKHDSNS